MASAKTKPQSREQAIARLTQNIRALRKAKKWSQAELAEKCGVHLNHISRIEIGKYTPSLEFVIKAARILGVTVDTLLSAQESNLEDARIEDKELGERLRMLETLDENERDAIITVIDSMLTKHKIRNLIGEGPAHPATY